MNAVEIEQAVTDLIEAPFNADAFPFAFLEAYGNKETTLKRLRTGNTNQSDIGGLLQRGNIHLKVAPPSTVAKTFTALRDSPATTRSSSGRSSKTSSCSTLEKLYLPISKRSIAVMDISRFVRGTVMTVKIRT